MADSTPLPMPPQTSSAHVTWNDSRPFCFHCGYDLRGLELPRACPECGELSDPVSDAAAARGVFANWRACLACLLKPSKAPSGLFYTLTDEQSARIARRREALWLWLPSILCVLTVSVGVFTTIDYDVKAWHYERDDPGRTPRGVKHSYETDRLFSWNLHLFRFGLLFSKPDSWEPAVERKRRAVGFSVPDSFETRFFNYACSPLFALLFGYLLARETFLLQARSAAIRRDVPSLQQAARAVWTLSALPLGMALWAWLIGLWFYVAGQLAAVSNPDPWISLGPGLAGTGGWLLATTVGFARLMKLDRVRLVVRSRLATWVLLAAITIGGPFAAVGGVMWLLH